MLHPWLDDSEQGVDGQRGQRSSLKLEAILGQDELPEAQVTTYIRPRVGAGLPLDGAWRFLDHSLSTDKWQQ